MDGGDAAAGRGGFKRCDEVSADNTIINQIMLRFRPIAPKPSGGSSGQASEAGSWIAGVGRRKRRYVRVSGTKRSGNSKGSSREGDSSKGGSRSEEDEVKTLRLLPDREEQPPARNGGRDPGPLDLDTGDQIGRPRLEGESWVTVLSLTKACMELEGPSLGNTDEDRWRNLEGDTCPGFISDGYSHVLWANSAYRRMVLGGESGSVAVNLVVEERLRVADRSPAFACMVRLKYTWWTGATSTEKSVVAPCDVWRMSNGGFAWRIDHKAGLSLSLVL